MIIDGIVYVDNTLLTSLASCSTAAWMRHVHGLTTAEETAALRSGSAGHDALAEYFRSLFTEPDHAIARALCAFRDSYWEYAQTYVRGDDRLSWDNTSAIVREWLEVNHDRLPWTLQRPDRVEIGFSCPLESSGKYVFYGRMDLEAVWNATGEEIGIEHKYSGAVRQPWWVKRWKYDSQISGYQWALRQHFPNVRGILVNAIEFCTLNSSTKICPKHKKPYVECRLAPDHWTQRLIGPYSRTDAQLEQWRLTALSLAQRYEYLATTYTDLLHAPYVRMQGEFNMGCRWCDFDPWCRLGRPIPDIATMFIHEPWAPFDPRLYFQAQPIGVPEQGPALHAGGLLKAHE